MTATTTSRPAQSRTLALLLALTLLCSAIHFADNAFRLDLYPGPHWLTRNTVLWAWTALPPLALLAVRSGSRLALNLYASLGFDGFAHFFAPHPHPMPLRCTLTVCAEAAASLALIAYVSLRRPHAENDLRKPASA